MYNDDQVSTVNTTISINYSLKLSKGSFPTVALAEDHLHTVKRRNRRQLLIDICCRVLTSDKNAMHKNKWTSPSRRNPEDHRSRVARVRDIVE